MKSGGRGQSLLLTMLLIAAMMLLPQRAWAQDESYGLTVAGTNVSAKNARNVLGDNDATVSFDEKTNTLTLEGARIEGGISWEGTHNFIPASGGSESNALTINILGNNTINGAITGNIGNNPPLIFTGGNTAAAELTINAREQQAISEFLELTGVGPDAPLHFVELNSSNTVNYGSPNYLICGNDPVTKVTITSATLYNIWIAGQQVTSNNISNVLGDKMVAFDNQSNTVILNGTTISNYSGDAIESLLGDLTIALAGSNSISCTGTAIKHASSGSTPTITFTTSNDNPGSLTLAGGEAVLDGFSNQAEPTCNNGLSWSLGQDGKTASVSEAETYGITVAGVPVSESNAANVLGDDNATVKFDAENSVLTLNGATIRGSVVSSLESLTISLIGSNSITSSDVSAINGTGVLTISKDSEATGAVSLELKSSSQSETTSPSVISGFSSFTTSLIDENGGAYNDNSKAFSNKDGSPVTFVTFTSELSSVKNCFYSGKDDKGTYYIGFECFSDNVKIVYSIDYVSSDMQDVVEAVYQNEDVLLGGPCTVTAWKRMGSVVSETITAKLFGLSEESLSVIYGKVSSKAAPTLQPAVGSADGLSISYNQSAVADFSNIATINEKTGEMTIVGPGTATFEVRIGEQEEIGCKVLNTENLQFTLTINPGYPIWVNDVQVTEANKGNVLGGETATVQFDGNSRLVLNGATLQKIETGLEEGAELELYLMGENTISGSTSAIIDTNQGMPKLVIGTGDTNPGTLTLGGTSGVIQGFQSAEIKHPLAILSSTPENATSLIGTAAAITAANIGAPLGLIVDDVQSTAQTQTTDINYTVPGSAVPTEGTNLTNLVINNVLYTLKDTQASDVKDDGFYNGEVVLNSEMTDEAVATLNGNVEDGTYVPGTSAYATAFKGLTFLLPAGTGTIELDTHTDETHEFHLKIGSQDPITVKNKVDNNDAKFKTDYAVSRSTYAYLYLVSTTTPAPAYDGHRAGPKASVSGGIGGLKVSSSSIVTPSVDPAAAYLLMDPSSDIATGSGSKYGVVVSNANVTDLPDDAFSSHKSASYIDLSGTKITGKHFSRVGGAFNDVNENTLIYLPAGNTATGANFIIGGICDDMRLKDDADCFEAAADFTAAKADFNRSFSTGTDARGNASCYTVFLPYAIQPDKANGTFYTFTDYNASTGTVNLNLVATPAANTAYIFQPAGNGAMKPMLSVEVSAAGSSASPDASSESNGLYGVYEEHTWPSAPDGIYCFVGEAKDGLKAGQFAKVGADTHIRPFRAYLRIASTSAPEFLSVDWGNGTTSIVPLDKSQVEQSGEGWWTITGFRLPSKPTEKGVYIHNNKKVVVK